MEKRIELEDFMKYAMVSNPQISPNAEKICFMVTRHNIEANDYETTLWLFDRSSNKVQPFTTGSKDTFPVFAPNSKQVAFTSRRLLKKEEPGAELWIINVDGGEAQHLLTQTGGVNNVRWSPDGKKILFRSAVKLREEEAGVKVFRDLPIYFDGMGFIYNQRIHLFLYDFATNEVKQLTEGNIDVLFAEFSNKGDYIAYVVRDRTPSVYKLVVTDLYIMPTSGKSAAKITASNMLIGPIAWSPDDQHLAFLGTDSEYGPWFSHEYVHVISINGEQIKNLTKPLDRTTQLATYCDVAGPFNLPQPPIWKHEGIYFLLSEHGKVNLYRATYPEGTIDEIIVGDMRIASFSTEKNIIAFSKTSTTEPTEIWMKEGSTTQVLTQFNAWTKEIPHVEPEHFEFTASDGERFDGWVMKPLGMEPGKSYPAILYIHGGPKSAFGPSYMYEFQFLAAQGYTIIYTNPRGSCGYSQDFADIRAHYGERDYVDIMEALDYVLTEYPFIDANRLGVTGISFGGFMTCWIIGHTNRFRAAVPQAAVTNYYSLFNTSDTMGTIGRCHMMGADPNADPWLIEEKFLEKSPIRYIKNVKTPTKILHWDEDYRVTLDQSIQYYAALQFCGVESEFVLLTGSSHGIFVAGKPKTKLNKIKHLIQWFDKYLKD